ncbi:rCG55464 [Rattus norvegicus]|uniref:RCG55464 n=1 Tax=Rattus norvegicus TaxID=10116 RepID=A6JR48_RAT|nr:rCG55464 [Rattus norvegicus]
MEQQQRTSVGVEWNIPGGGSQDFPPLVGMKEERRKNSIPQRMQMLSEGKILENKMFNKLKVLLQNLRQSS